MQLKWLAQTQPLPVRVGEACWRLNDDKRKFSPADRNGSGALMQLACLSAKRDYSDQCLIGSGE